MDRKSHLEWCKKRAHEYLAHGDVQNAVTSMLSDLNKHPETELKSPTLTMLGMVAIQSGDVSQARRFIDGFN
jgi:outer membrane protein assembly factor BamD (BamD/ComL family)